MGEMMRRLGCGRQLAGPGSDVNTCVEWEGQLCKAMVCGEDSLGGCWTRWPDTDEKMNLPEAHKTLPSEDGLKQSHRASFSP